MNMGMARGIPLPETQMETAQREPTLDAVKTDQMQLRDALSEAHAVADSIRNHLAGESNMKSEGPSEARPEPSGMLGQMCMLGSDNQQSLNRLMTTLQQISSLTGAS
jgi:hypothetical protein